MVEYALELGLLLVGVVTLVIGYRRNRRNVLVVAALLLFASGTLVDFGQGFRAGLSATTGLTP